MERPRDYYQLLGVPRDASRATIKRAYRRLARNCHPDVSNEASGETFKELRAAYETLADDERRRRYDESLGRTERRQARESSPVWGPGAGELRRPLERGALAGEILLSPAEAARGGVLPLEVPISAVCDLCEGTGGLFFDCDGCLGEGQVGRRLPVPLRIPPGVRDGAVFQIRTDHPTVPSILLTVHVNPF